jgi:hypothetical protein
MERSWGFHPNFASGTRSRTRRVTALSYRNSAAITSVSFIVLLPPCRTVDSLRAPDGNALVHYHPAKPANASAEFSCHVFVTSRVDAP